MTELTGDKNYIDKLLKALSVEEAIESFTEVDDRILDLLKCSSEDFLSLNDQFKSYHKESKNISLNANTIFEIFTNRSINKSFEELKDFSGTFDELTVLFSAHIENLDSEIKKTNNKIDNLKIANKNYTQNLSSLNLILSGFIKPASHLSNPATSQQIHENIEQSKKLIAKTDLLTENFTNAATKLFLLLTNIKKENFDHLQLLDDKIKLSFKIFQEKYTEAINILPVFKEQSERNAANIAKIITNLQYHDIIRQKIEHIQRTHKDIMCELQSYLGNENSMSIIHSKAKTFLKIRDVAGLQAAQLLHANRQYQLAIEEIGKDLEEIGNELITIGSSCENLVGKSEKAKNYYLTHIVENLDAGLGYTQKIVETISGIRTNYTEITEIFDTLTNTYQELKTNRTAIAIEVAVFLQPDAASANLLSAENKQEVANILDSLQLFENHIHEIISAVHEKVERIYGPIQNFSKETALLHKIEHVSTTLPALIQTLKINISKIDELLYINSSISLGVQDKIKNSLGNIRYYEMFERSSDKIIEELNSINIKLNYGEGISSKDREDNLKHLKARYTMASEHIIHEQVTKMTGADNSIDPSAGKVIEIADENSEADDDNLELF